MFALLIGLSFATDISMVINKAAEKHKISPVFLHQVLKVESGPKVFNGIRLNKNGTFDIGPFQINSIHINNTCKEYILTNVQDNANCAAKMIRKLKQKWETKDENWLSRYHSNTPEKRKIYEKKLFLAKDF